MTDASIDKDINYYVEILRKGNLMEAQDPYLCLSLLIKCMAIIEKSPQKFVEVYPDRKEDLKVIRNRVLYLRKKYGDRLKEDEKDSVMGTSFLSFINEAMGRVNILASRFEYKKALTVLSETKKIAKDYGLTDQLQILSEQEKLYKGEQEAYQKKLSNLDKLSTDITKLEKAKVLPPIVTTCEKIIPLAQETGKKDVVEKFSEKKEKTQLKIQEQSALLPQLIQKAQDLERTGDLKGANDINLQIIETARQLDQKEMQQQFQAQKDTLQTKIEMVSADQQTKLKTFLARLEDNRKKNNLTDAIYDCTQIIETLSALNNTAKIPNYVELKKELQAALQKQQEDYHSQLEELKLIVEKNQKSNPSVALGKIPKLLELASKVKDQETFEKYNTLQNELREAQKIQDADFNVKLAELNKKLDQQLAKHKLTEAIETCKELIAFVKLNNKKDLETLFTNRLEELTELFEQEEKILDSQIAQMEKNIEEQSQTNQLDLAIESMDNLINVANKNHRDEIATKYTQLREKTLAKNQELRNKIAEEEAKRKADQDAQLKAENERKLKEEEELQKKNAAEQQKRKDEELARKKAEEDRLRKASEKVNQEQADLKRREEEILRIQKQVEAEMIKRQEESKKHQEDILKQQELLKNQKEQERLQNETQIKAKMEEITAFAQRLKAKENELNAREDALKSKEQEFVLKEKFNTQNTQSNSSEINKIKISPIVESADTSSKPLPEGFVELLKQFGLTDLDIDVYSHCSQAIQTLPNLAKKMNKEEKDPVIKQTLKKLDESGFLLQKTIENILYIIPTPPYILIEWLIQEFKQEINALRAMQIAKLNSGENKNATAGPSQVDRLNDLMKLLSKLEGNLNTDVSDKETKLQVMLNKLKDQETGKGLDKMQVELNTLITSFSTDLQNEKLDSNLFLIEDTEKSSLEGLSSNKDFITLELDTILDTIFTNLEKLQLGVIQKAVNNVIKTILSNELSGVETRITNELKVILKNPIHRIIVSVNNQFLEKLYKPLLNAITDNVDQFSEENSDKNSTIEEIYTLFGQIVNEYGNSLKKAKNLAGELSGNVLESVKSLDIPVKIEINENFHKTLDLMDTRVQKSLHAIDQIREAVPPITITKTVETVEIQSQNQESQVNVSSRLEVSKKSPGTEKPKNRFFSEKPKVAALPKKTEE